MFMERSGRQNKTRQYCCEDPEIKHSHNSVVRWLRFDPFYRK